MSAHDGMTAKVAPTRRADTGKVSGSEESIPTLVAEIRAACPANGRIVFVSGNFNIIHPGHLRLLNFAAQCGEMLVVGVNADTLGGALLREDLRLESVRSIGVVDRAFLLRVPAEAFIARLQPAIVVKGKEHETRTNPELEVVECYGGKLLFSSGEIRFSSLDLLRKDLYETNYSNIVVPHDFPARHHFNLLDLAGVVRRFSGVRVVVIGDLIIDEYITCEALGMSREDPTLVVSPIRHDRFLGGASIVAAHAAGLGADVHYFSIVGADPIARFASETLEQHNVVSHLVVDDSRPTTLKQRYRATSKTLLRVSHLRQHDIDASLANELLERIMPVVAAADLLIFSDFSYGCLPQAVVDAVADECKRRGVLMVADSQSSSQVGDISRFRGARLVTPTEHEARIAVRDFKSGLPVLAESLRQKADAQNVLITLGGEGLLIHAGGEDDFHRTDQLPAFNRSPRDVAGAGDSLLVGAALALAVGADIWKSAYIGSIAAACQVGRVGNLPLGTEQILAELLL